MKILNTNKCLSSLTKKKSFPKISLSQRVSALKRIKRLQKNKLICEKCDKRFSSWWALREHWISTDHKTPEQCRWCKKKTFALQSHLCKEHWNLASMCSFCGQLFMFRENKEKHQLNHDETEYRCFLCGRRRKTEQLLRNHMYGHYIFEKYGCNVCEKRFKKKKSMEKHLKTIHFICQYCGMTCRNKNEFNDHIKAHNDLKCVFCHKVFSQRNRLKYHFQLQHGHQDFYKCTLCFQRFAMKGRLLDHIKLKHNGVSKFSCKICMKPFLYWTEYIQHFEKVHIKSTADCDQFTCSFCGYTTDVKFKLQYHVEKTSGMGFFCKKCQIRLDCKGMFEKHMETHKGECLWTCDYCPRIYSSEDTLNHHMSLVHREVVIALNPCGYPCLEPGCYRYYTVKNSLARHMRKSHSEVEVSSTSCPLSKNKFVDGMSFSNKIRRQYKGRIRDKKITNNFKIVDEPSTSKSYHHMVTRSDTTEVNVYYCGICNKFWFEGETQFNKHMSSHEKRVWEGKCTSCTIILESPEDAAKHYTEDHLKVKFIQ